MKSRQWPKIAVHGENHGNRADREFVIFLQPLISGMIDSAVSGYLKQFSVDSLAFPDLNSVRGI